jgi:hypothetical protein
MKKFMMIAAICGAFTAITAVGTATPAAARDSFSFSFDTGNVYMGYTDGYYDRDHRWHRWRNAREHREWRNRYHTSYRAMRHDEDRDGIPDRFDRDRDGDGVPNRYDARPNNPFRD